VIIPRRKLEGFVRDIVNQCFSSRQERANRGQFFENYFTTGSADPSNAAMFNKTYASIDDLESLLFSPVSLRFKISDPDNPNVVNEAKGRAGASRIRHHARKSDTDTLISAAVRTAIVKGKGLIKTGWKRGEFHSHIIAPESFGVLRENHTRLDEDMEAFAQTMLITPHQFARLVYNHPDRSELIKKARRYVKQGTGTTLQDTSGGSMPIVVGGLYPFQPAGVAATSQRGIVDWMSQPKPSLAPEVQQQLLELNEVWVWDDQQEDWVTFQMVGTDMLILGKNFFCNALAYDTDTCKSSPSLKGRHPYAEFCVNPVEDYFWGRSEIAQLIGLQEAINARIVGTNRLLRLQEDPTIKFIGSTGINQQTLSRYKKPGGYFTDTNPNAKVEKDNVVIPQDIWGSLHEYERMHDDLMGLPPTARGKNESGVRSAQHANTLVRQFSPRFKDRALLIERDVEAIGGLMLDICRANDPKKLTAWVPAHDAGTEGQKPSALEVPPADGLMMVSFQIADLPEDAVLTVDSHSSSPAFLAEAKATDFDLVKIGAMGPEDIVDHLDVSDPDELRMGILRREIAKAKAQKEQEAIKLLSHQGHGGKH
jgi:hypothetical protein